MPNKKIALLVFARSVEEELKYKPFLAQKSLASILQIHTTNIAKESGLPIIFYDETKQLGKDFGARFSNALQNIYREGYDNIIVIGNDCPQLERKHIVQAKKALLNDNTVIGPTNDGGFYLLGISKDNFNYNTFLNFNWNKDTLFNEISSSLSNSVTLQRLRDVDYYSDIQLFSLKTIFNKVLRGVIQSIQKINVKIFFNNNLNRLQFLRDIILNKGSPNIPSTIQIRTE